MIPRIYLAGPDVFLPNPLARAATLKAICTHHGLHGISPLDALEPEPPSWTALPLAHRIALRNEAHIASAAALVANLTPFRGPSADAGTVFELGFMRALGRPVFGWSNTRLGFCERTRAFLGAHATPDENGEWRDGDHMLVENFGLADNLMIEAAITASGGHLATTDAPAAELWTNLTAFETCIAVAAGQLRGNPVTKRQ